MFVVCNDPQCSFCGTKRDDVAIIGTGPSSFIYACSDCLNDLRSMALENKDEVDDPLKEFEIKTPRVIKDALDACVIGQEKAKKAVAVGIYNHYKRISKNRTDIQKTNILLAGPTGCGKTEIARTVAEILDVPFCICDATSLTQAGYVGDDVENILLRLIQAADYDIEAAEKGIIYIDEIDKIARAGSGRSITRDVSGEGVQQALLKIIEGAKVSVPANGGRKHPNGENIMINTDNILFICGGAFESMTMSERDKKQPLGFSTGSTAEKQSVVDSTAMIPSEDLRKQGLIPELIGRLPVRIMLSALTKEDLSAILTDTKNSLVKQYTDLFSLDDVKLSFTREAIQYIATKAYEEGTGARGLKSIIEDLMMDAMFEIPDKNIEEAKVCVKDNSLIVKMNKRKDSLRYDVA